MRSQSIQEYKVLRTDAAGVTAIPGPVVEHFNVIEDIRPGQIPGFLYSLPDAFFFQRTEERFGHRVIPAVATSAHARGQVIGPAEALPVVTAILGRSGRWRG